MKRISTLAALMLAGTWAITAQAATTIKEKSRSVRVQMLRNLKHYKSAAVGKKSRSVRVQMLRNLKHYRSAAVNGKAVLTGRSKSRCTGRKSKLRGAKAGCLKAWNLHRSMKSASKSPVSVRRGASKLKKTTATTKSAIKIRTSGPKPFNYNMLMGATSKKSK